MSNDHTPFREPVITPEFIEQLKQKIRASLPEPLYTEVTIHEAWIPLSDGVKLFASVTMPKGEGPWPVILNRNPYGADDRTGSFLGQFFAEQGYAFVYNRVRGTGRSEGEFTPFVHERTDGREVVDWIAKQPWCNGNIGTFGGSYLGHVQWCIADYEHPALKTMFIQNYGIRPYHLFYRNGMFRQDIFTEWACQMMEDNRRHNADSEYIQEQVRRGFQVFPQIELGKQLKGKDCVWYNEWITHTSEDDPYWAEGFWRELRDSLAHIHRPIMLQAGWFDVFCRAQIESWRALPAETRARSRFVIGPWHHMGTVGGDLTYPNHAILGPMQIAGAVEWFDYQLKGKPYPHQLGVIEAYSIGDNRWKIWKDDITAGKERTFYLGEEGTLAAEARGEGEVHYVYDPDHPTPSISHGLGKASCYGPGIGTREGVVSFVSDPLTEDIHIAGQIVVELYVRSSAPATAFAVTVMETFEDERSVWICEDITDIRWDDGVGPVPYEPGTTKKLTLRMQDMTWMLRRGSRLRIDIASSNYPLYHVHPNTVDNWASSTRRVTARQTICYGAGTPSRVVLPEGV